VTLREAVEQVLAAVPELRPSYDDHLREYEELLDHVFLGDVSRFVVAAQACGADDVVDRTLSTLEALLRLEDVEIRELVSVSFVENIAWDEDEASERVRERLPPLLADELRRQRDWRRS
jgi:hypothetical protein